jgi:hypothetical protein
MMNDFYAKRRERFLNEEPARKYREFLLGSIENSFRLDTAGI